MTKHQKLKSSLKKQYNKGFVDGENKATRFYTDLHERTIKSHEKLVRSLTYQHSKVEKSLMTQYNRLIMKKQKEIDQIQKTKNDIENKRNELSQILAEGREMTAIAKQQLYQDRKLSASIMENEYTINDLESRAGKSLKDGLIKTTLAKEI